MRLKRRAAVAFLSSAIATGGLTAALWGQPKPEPVKAVTRGLSKEDDQAVRKIVAGFEAAWNAHDMNAIATLFHDDAEWVNVVGMHWHGRDEIMVAHAAFHQTIFKTHSYHTDAVETRSVAPGVAVAVATETVDGFTTPDGHVQPKARDRLTCVLVKGPDGWRIAHGHNVVVDEDAAKNDPVKSRRK